MAPVFSTVLTAAGGRRHARLLLLLYGLGGAGLAQISPGKLSKAHEFLDNPVKCFNCHAAGIGRPQLKCLACHAEIRLRLASKKGLHAKAMKGGPDEQACGACHAEHLGVEHSLIEWPEGQERFDHRKADYPLLGRHANVRCARCHQARHVVEAERAKFKRASYNRTFLGLTPECSTCHQDRHAGQVGANCARCHTVEGWRPATGFQHESAKFRLAGRHAQVACEKCHKPLDAVTKTVQYTGLPFLNCTPCHQDPHGGAFKQNCESCHADSGWKELRQSSSFDHSKSVFPLEGKHAKVFCQKCHKTANFSAPVAHAKCLDCHQEAHGAQFRSRAGQGDCRACHSANGWTPSTFDAARHQETAYPLLGKHAAVKCAGCHVPAGAATNYHPAAGKCLQCHKDAHESQFASGPWANMCERCHVVDGFAPSTFSLAQHRETRFALPGAHAAVPCSACHHPAEGAPRNATPFHFASIGCVDCHQDPHQSAPPLASLKTDCASCHTTNNWRTTISFDHGSTQFQLEGAHRAIACAACHKPARAANGSRHIPFAGTPARCSDCHEDIHGGQFRDRENGAGCGVCHTSSRWKPSQFDHDKHASFALTGIHRDVPCQLCHRQRNEIAGAMVLVYRPTPGRCVDCH